MALTLLRSLELLRVTFVNVIARLVWIESVDDLFSHHTSVSSSDFMLKYNQERRCNVCLVYGD
jgi:hypothetical protein